MSDRFRYSLAKLKGVDVVEVIVGDQLVGYLREVPHIGRTNKHCLRYRIHASWRGEPSDDRRLFTSRKEAADEMRSRGVSIR